MARPRKPVSLHLVQGTYEPSRHKNRVEPEVSGPLGDAPKDWPAPAKVLWHEIVDLAPGFILAKSDRIVVEGLCRLVLQMPTKPFNCAVLSELRRYLGLLGMSPADRSRVTSILASSGSGASPEVDRFFS
jgi:hypothetical protein